MIRAIAPALGPRVQPPQFNAQHRALKTLHAIVESDKFVSVTRGLAVRTRGAREFRDAFIVRGERATFSVCAQIF